MNKSIFLFTILLFLFACSTPKFKYFDPDEVKDFRNVKSVNVQHISLYKEKPDTSKIDMFFNNKNLLVKQIDYYDNYHSTYYMTYNNQGLIIKTNSTLNDTIDTGFRKYEYDKKNNLISTTNYANGETHSGKKYEYDKNNNKIKDISLFHGEITREYALINNYKERSVQESNLDSKRRNSYVFKMFYDKYGNQIKSARISKSGDTISQNKIIYDEFGIIKRYEIYRNDKLIHIRTYENIYDSHGNVIERVMYENKIPKRKSLFQLTY
ncbi:MAG: hypothetical protein ACSHXF_13440 [Aquaticitalea sp.]